MSNRQLKAFVEYPPPDIIDGREYDKTRRKYLADLGRLVANRSVRGDEALATLNHALADAHIPADDQSRATAHFLWYAEGKAPPADALQTVWDIVTRNLSRLMLPNWCAPQFAPLYFAAWILGANGRMFPFACPAFAELSGLNRASILHFRRTACLVGFMCEIDPGQQGGKAATFALGPNVPMPFDYDGLRIVSHDIETRCKWISRNHAL